MAYSHLGIVEKILEKYTLNTKYNNKVRLLTYFLQADDRYY